jgi:hypothetical protein
MLLRITVTYRNRLPSFEKLGRQTPFYPSKSPGQGHELRILFC